jgi:hypothetical protein
LGYVAKHNASVCTRQHRPVEPRCLLIAWQGYARLSMRPAISR